MMKKFVIAISLLGLMVTALPSQKAEANPATTLGIVGTALGGSALALGLWNTTSLYRRGYWGNGGFGRGGFGGGFGANNFGYGGFGYGGYPSHFSNVGYYYPSYNYGGFGVNNFGYGGFGGGYGINNFGYGGYVPNYYGAFGGYGGGVYRNSYYY